MKLCFELPLSIHSLRMSHLLLNSSLILITLLTAIASAQQTVPGTGAAAPARPAVTDQERAAALTFVAEHHPELAALLTQLQKSRPAEFERAIRELVPQTQAIQRLQERSPARYEAQLRAWQVDSQIRVLMARWSRKPDAESETKVRELIARRQQLRLEQTLAEKQRLTEQLQKLTEQLQLLEQPENQRVQTEWEQLSRRATTAAKQAAKLKTTNTAEKKSAAKNSSAREPAAAKPSAGSR